MQLTAVTLDGLLRVAIQHRIDFTKANLMGLKKHLGPDAEEILSGQYADFVLAMENLGFNTPESVDALTNYLYPPKTKKSTEATKVEEPLKKAIDFDWDCLPKWCNNYIAMDLDGTWYCFEAIPTIAERTWTINGYDCTTIPKEFEPDWVGRWEDSLHYNPKFGNKAPGLWTGYEFEYSLDAEARIQEELGQEIYDNCSSMGGNLSEVEAEKIEIDVLEYWDFSDLSKVSFKVSVAYYGDNENIRAAVDRTCENMNPETFKHGLRP